MSERESKRKTLVGAIHPDVLAFTVGQDPRLDLDLVEWDCLGSAAHVTMLSRMRITPVLFLPEECEAVIRELVAIMRLGRDGAFAITAEDQDVHLAVERHLTERLGDLGRRIHTGRSRNDQVAVDLRLHARDNLLGVFEESTALADALLALARRHLRVPMVGRTHLQPAMPSSVGLWASGYAEGLLDDLLVVESAYAYADRCPLGSAAGYGVPLPLDRKLTARLLAFSAPHHNVFHASNTRGKCEAVILGALLQRAGGRRVGAVLRVTIRQLAPITLALVGMLGLSRVMVHAGMTATLALAAAGAVGGLWPLVAPLVGVLGTFITGSATASNILFGELQVATARDLGMPTLTLLAAQDMGAAMGNMICPHNIIAGGATVGLAGREGEVLRRTLWPGLLYALLAGALALGLIALGR